MWRMQDGDRVFTDAEWEVFGAGLDSLRCDVEDDIDGGSDDSATGVAVFDRLTAEQKLALLAEVASALRDPAVPTPAHTAANEGAVVAVLLAFLGMLRDEVDAGGADRADLRQLLLAAFAPGGGPLPRPTDRRRDAWEDLYESLEGRVLWDHDYATGDLFLDLPPDAARERLALAGIDPGYYLDAPPVRVGRGLAAARQTLARLIGLPVPDDDGLYPCVEDLYHGLSVGPVSPEQSAAWGDGPWTRAVGALSPGWDCDFPTWAAEFSNCLPAEPFDVSPAGPGPVPDLPEGFRVEPVEGPGGGWAVRDGDGLFWWDPVDNGWVEAPSEDDPALTFGTEADARAAIARAGRMYAEREVRREAALARIDLLDAG